MIKRKLTPRMKRALCILDRMLWTEWPWDMHNIHLSTLNALCRRGLVKRMDYEVCGQWRVYFKLVEQTHG